MKIKIKQYFLNRSLTGSKHLVLTLSSWENPGLCLTDMHESANSLRRLQKQSALGICGFLSADSTFLIKYSKNPGMVTLTYNPSAWELRQEDHHKFKASLSYIVNLRLP